MMELMAQKIQNKPRARGARVVLLTLLVSIFLLLIPQSNVCADQPSDRLVTGLIDGEPFRFDRGTLHSRTACLSVVKDGQSSDLLHFRHDETVYIASLTKMMTALVAYELLMESGGSLDEQATVRSTDLQGLAELNASVAGFQAGEVLPIRDLFYGLLLSSGCEAANTLGRETAGNVTSFVEQMNDKAKELQLRHSRFTNTSGLFDVHNYASAKDMTDVLIAISKIDFLKEVMGTRYYTSKASNKHPNGLTMIHTLTLYGAEAELDTKIIDGGKTGQLKESGYCLSSYKQIGDRLFVLTTTGAEQSGQHVADHVAVYEALLTQLTGEDTAITGIGERIPIIVEPGASELDPLPHESSPSKSAPVITTIAVVLLAVLMLLGLILLVVALMKRKMEEDQGSRK